MSICFNIDDGSKKQSYLLQELLTIGRSPKNDIVIESDTVSSFHGQFYRSKSSLFYKDLSSKNGSFINGDKIFLCRFYIEDELTIGETSITIDKKKLTKDEEKSFSRIPPID